jgi:hypothetical protein
MLCYSSFGQFTKPFILLNMDPNGMNYLVQLLYVLGILCTSPLLMVPVFKIIEKSALFDYFPSKKGDDNYKVVAMRQIIMLAYTTVAYFIPNLNQFLNFVGGVNGTFLVFILPVMFYLKEFRGEIGILHKGWLYFVMIFGTTGGLISIVTSINAMMGTE